MYGAASAYASRLTPDGMHETMQALIDAELGKISCQTFNTRRTNPKI